MDVRSGYFQLIDQVKADVPGTNPFIGLMEILLVSDQSYEDPGKTQTKVSE